LRGKLSHRAWVSGLGGGCILPDNDVAEGSKNEEKAVGLWVELSEIVHYIYCVRDARAGTGVSEEGGEFVREDNEGGREEEISARVSGF
jgi:hypothetical protein